MATSNDITITDGDFYSWSSFYFVDDDPYVSGSPKNVSTGVVSQMSSGGNSGAFLQMKNNFTYGDTIWTGAIKTDYDYNFKSNGGIVSLSVSADLKHPSTGSTAWEIVVEQNGIRYFSVPWVSFSQNNSWLSVSALKLKSSDFDTNPWAGNANIQPDGNHPDFSSSASPIHFGFMFGNRETGGGTIATEKDLDNFSLTVITDINHAPTGTLEITGTAQQNQTLSVKSTLADADGLGSLNYQWLSNGSVISGATQTTYTLTANDVGKNISIKASYIDLKNNAESVTSNATGLVAAQTVVNHAPTGSVTISGTPQEGQTLTASNTLADVDGMGNVSYQWYWIISALGGMWMPIDGATQNTYTIKYVSDVSRSMYDKIAVEASYIDLKGKSEKVDSNATGIVAAQTVLNHPATGSLTISGTPQVGQTLTANNALVDADGMGKVVSYQWSKTDDVH